MPLYVRDYLADTAELSTLEHGAYLLLIMNYWQKGGLPIEDAKLAKIVRLRMEQWRKVKPAIERFFGPSWTHKRIEAELHRSAAISLKRRTARRAFVGTNVRHLLNK